jgi:hypothetical protein
MQGRQARNMRFSPSRTAALIFILASLAAPALAGIEKIKFDLADLSEADKRDIIEQATTLGAIEAQFEYCGLKTEIVTRATRAVQSCVTAESLKRVIAEFRRSKSDMENSLKTDTVDCSDEERRSWYKKTRAAIDKYIDNITRMCRNCLVC